MKMAYSAQSSDVINKFDIGSISINTHVEPPFELKKIFEIFANSEIFLKNWN